MRISRIHTTESLQLSQTVTLENDRRHYLVQVLRLKEGDTVHVFNAQDGEFVGEIESVSKQAVAIKLTQPVENKTESPIVIHLGQALVSRDKMDLIIQKAVELGVHSVTPILTEHANVKLKSERLDKRLAHWQAVAVSACEQSGRLQVPTIHAPVSLNEWVNNNQSELKLILEPVAEKKWAVQQAVQSVSILVGPEGGFSQQEIEVAMQRQFEAVRLGPRILRTETAAMSSIALIQYEFGDFS